MTVRAERACATREQILTAAERLFAEHGVFAVSNRQVSEAAGQGNNAAVGYHFGTKTDLVRAIVRKHIERIERVRRRMLAETAGSGEVRDWVACLVRPVTLPELPPDVRAERRDMTSHLMAHVCAERERALAEDTPTTRADWHDTATGLIDATVGLWTAPVTAPIMGPGGRTTSREGSRR
ncbi:TetR/AcrR family transcriptional regulator [Nonomuraea sp. NPDC003201]